MSKKPSDTLLKNVSDEYSGHGCKCVQSYLIAHFRRDQFRGVAQVLTEFFGLFADRCLTGSAHYFILDPIEAIHSEKNMITLYHTSPNPITKIDTLGRFGDCMFFASEPYSIACGPVLTYRMEIDSDNVIEANSFFFREDYRLLDDVVADVMDMTGCDEDTAQEILSERTSVYDIDIEGIPPEDRADMAWDVQALIGKCATILGVDAIEATDEQGTVWIVPMTGKLDRLELTDFEL